MQWGLFFCFGRQYGGMFGKSVNKRKKRRNLIIFARYFWKFA
ncbi:hypothetical protein CLOBOL_01320 [Enterocloster bolteae ATCC BAA-613]|uniref:Uncharacterized protein n=1 Tax=Enterocloster bolteae (strain ATCC BAA-613 / DSM 15670 / CCUG 46953 / JCM 12243 / WAL 16351) TaxID=411902 RepID=A8RKH6_ENTBW|nr:hypothetical protein CLOBOL_01320 [Enterocloster bolteae ATCC BAA-613]